MAEEAELDISKDRSEKQIDEDNSEDEGWVYNNNSNKLVGI